MLRILIAEDDPNVASTLQHLIEENPLYSVVGVVDDAEGAIELASVANPDIALIDLHLARGSTGFAAAAQLREMGVLCLFVSGKAPSFPMGDLAIGCLSKPFTANDLHLSLSIAEDHLRDRGKIRSKLPESLILYGDPSPSERLSTPLHHDPGFKPSRPSLKTKLLYWLTGVGKN